MASPSWLQQSLHPSGTLILTFSNGPVNALAARLRIDIANAIKDANANPEIKAVVLTSDYSKGFFSGGADISEFASFAEGSSPLVGSSDAYDLAEAGEKPVVAAIGGVCFGGGLEIVLCCAARVSTRQGQFALPELKLGIIPGLGGTQRLPRLVGFKNGLEMMIYSSTVNAKSALDVGLVDELVEDPNVLVDRAVQVAMEIASGKRKRNVSLLRNDKLASKEECEQIARQVQSAPSYKKVSANGAMKQFDECVRVSLLGVAQGGQAGIREEANAFARLVASPESKSLVHLFFAQRKPVVPLDISRDKSPARVTPREIKSIGIVGGGLMGAGIATVMLKAGLEVVIKEIDEKAADAAKTRVARNLGSKTAGAGAGTSVPRLVVTTSWDAFSNLDMVIEAVLENVKLKQEIMKTMAEKTPTHCILATNTSTINIDLVASLIPREHYEQGRVIGAHFFSPAHIMPLFEIVQTSSTSPAVVDACIKLAKKVKKTPVVVGNCAGFAVNRMYFPQGQIATFLVTSLGIHPYDVDRAMESFGVPMGAFRLLDLVGLDIGVAVGGVYDMAYADRSYSDGLLPLMLNAGRKGQKSGAGFYKYDKDSGDRTAKKDNEELNKFIDQIRRDQQRKGKLIANDMKLTDQQIVEMVLLPCVNEGCRILAEKVVANASDLDICSVFGMGFPQYRGGLMYWANQSCGGPRGIMERLKAMREMSGGNVSLFTPSHALLQLVRAQCLDLQAPPKPICQPGLPDDIVIVSAYRTAVGRAYRGGLKDTPVDDLMAPLIEKIMLATGIKPQEVDDVVVGMVLPRGDSGVVQTRVAGLLGGLPETTPVRTVNRLCSSGLQAIADAASAIQSGHYNVAIAGGVESMSASPFTNKDLSVNPKARDRVKDCYLSMGETSENVAERYGVSRERQDRVAVMSHYRAGACMLSGKQIGEIVPIKTLVKIPKNVGGQDGKTVQPVSTKSDNQENAPVEFETRKITVAMDEGIRLGVTAASLAKLKPVFRKDGSTTAGNSSQLSDGAALVMVMKRSEARHRGLPIRATLRAYAVAGVEPSVMGIGPAVAIPKVLEKAGLTKEDIDLFEINEAFGSQADYCIEYLGLNRDIVNVNGGAIAIGHPLGMSGARLTVSIIHELERRGGKYGVVSMCIGTGMGAAAVFEITNDSSTCRM
eukprot:CAMPEP_0184692404 /NCGR_PEP_ID=MMETSP0313-20130426/900_1 /TAXON_ID=2792 /ORGANISM="Porphyridium aerugineum, Strain SAG 1380-2" /LENGTH=1163 /DNA_ID=CAMNT_0027150231 /DNA_START=106 /DNA_END=3597 /DNA_ORIENTATION=+